MVELHTYNQTGTECPNCGHNGVLKEDIFGGFLKLFYKYTLYKCHVCYKYEVKIDEVKSKLNNQFNAKQLT